jgi:hypothetical protein
VSGSFESSDQDTSIARVSVACKEYAAVLKKHKATAEKQQQRLRDVHWRSMRALKLSFGSCCCDGGFYAT